MKKFHIKARRTGAEYPHDARHTLANMIMANTAYADFDENEHVTIKKIDAAIKKARGSK